MGLGGIKGSKYCKEIMNQCELVLSLGCRFAPQFVGHDFSGIKGAKVISIDLEKEENRVIVDYLKWNGQDKKNGFELVDYITVFKIENSHRPSKSVIYPIAILLLIIFLYLNSRLQE